MKASLLVHLGASILAVVAICAVIAEPAGDAKVFCDHGVEYFNRGEWKKAVEELNKAIDLDPKNANAYFWRGCAKLKLGDTEGTKADMLKSATLDPKVIKEHLTPPPSPPKKVSIEEYTQAIEKDPKDQKAYVGRGREKALRGDDQGAIEDFTKAIELDPADAGAFFDRGLAKATLPDPDLKGAFEDFNRTIKLDPRNAGAYQMRGDIERTRKEWKSAMADFQEAIALDPELKEDIQPLLVECQMWLSKKDNAGGKK